MAAEAHESNCQKWPKMAICESPNGQNDPRNINRKYTDQEWKKMFKNYPKFPVSTIFNNFHFMTQVIRATQSALNTITPLKHYVFFQIFSQTFVKQIIKW